MLGNIGSVEILLIMTAILLVFGAKRIPEIARGLGHGIREFRQAAREISGELKLEDDPLRRTNSATRATRHRPADGGTQSGTVVTPAPQASPPLGESTPAEEDRLTAF